MKSVKKWVQLALITFGMNMALLFIYEMAINPPIIDRFVRIITAVLSAICALWICGDIKGSDGDE